MSEDATNSSEQPRHAVNTTASGVHWAPHVLHKHLAPGISAFTSAIIPDMSTHDPESGYWVANHFLNSAVGTGGYQPPVDALAACLMRRAEGSFAEHAAARTATADFLRPGGRSGSGYFAAVRHWDYFLSEAWQAHALLIKLIQVVTDAPDFKAFQRDDGSVEQRLNLLYNASKHLEKRIAAGQILPDTVSPTWLSNRGLECTDGFLSWEETAEVLREIAMWADVFVEPATAARKFDSTSQP
jgi:hypothetical protein